MARWNRSHYLFFFSLLVGAAGLVAFSPIPVTRHDTTSRYFRVEAGNFEYSPAVIRVNPGDRVTIQLASLDVVHGLYLDGYAIDLIADPGKTEIVSFTADLSGTFQFRCSVTCGDLHPFMVGKFKVGQNLLYWRGIGLLAIFMYGLFIIQFYKNRIPDENAGK